MRRVYEAVARGDAESVMALYDPAVEWHTGGALVGHFTGDQVLHGHDGLRAFFHDFYEGFQDVEYALDDVIDTGAHVISVVTMRGRGRTSAIEVDMPQFGLWTVRDARVTAVRWFQTRDEALRAAGVTP